jgi:hypothetical protein
LIVKLAEALDADQGELLLLAKMIPEPIRPCVLERPEAFRKLAELDDEALGLVVAEAESRERKGDWRRKPKSR